VSAKIEAPSWAEAQMKCACVGGRSEVVRGGDGVRDTAFLVFQFFLSPWRFGGFYERRWNERSTTISYLIRGDVLDLVWVGRKILGSRQDKGTLL
jgi:hypothetical protein